MNLIRFTPTGLRNLALVVREARGNLSYVKFQNVTGLSHATIWQIEKCKVDEVRLSTMVALAPHTRFSLEELVTICGGGVEQERPSLSEQGVVEAWEVLKNMNTDDVTQMCRQSIERSPLTKEQLVELLRAIAAKLERLD